MYAYLIDRESFFPRFVAKILIARDTCKRFRIDWRIKSISNVEGKSLKSPFQGITALSDKHAILTLTEMIKKPSFKTKDSVIRNTVSCLIKSIQSIELLRIHF